jgi:sugar phosphate isomerase/epimerase
MKGLSCNSGLLHTYSVEQSMDILVEHGYQAIDISLELAPPFLPPPKPHMDSGVDAARRRAVRDYARKAGIAIGALNAHTNVIHGDPEERRRNTEFIRGALQLAADMEVPYVISGCGVKLFYGWESTYWEWCIEAMRDLTADAERLGVMILIEAASPYGSLVHNLARLQRLLDTEGLEGLGVLFDPAHYHVRGDSVLDAYLALGDKVKHMHAKDARGNSENFGFPPLGEGEIDFARLIASMVKGGFSGYISVEYEAMAWGYPDDPLQVLADGKAFVEEILERV